MHLMETIGRQQHEAEMLSLKRSIAGLISAAGAERDGRGRFVKRGHEAPPPLAPWWMAL